MDKINSIKAKMNDRFKDYPEFQLLHNGNHNLYNEYDIEFKDDKYIIVYYDWRNKKELYQSAIELEVIRELTLIFSEQISLDFAKKNKLEYIDNRILWFAKHVDLLLAFKEFEIAKIKIMEYTELLGCNIFGSYEEIYANMEP